MQQEQKPRTCAVAGTMALPIEQSTSMLHASTKTQKPFQNNADVQKRFAQNNASSRINGQWELDFLSDQLQCIRAIELLQCFPANLCCGFSSEKIDLIMKVLKATNH